MQSFGKGWAMNYFYSRRVRNGNLGFVIGEDIQIRAGREATAAVVRCDHGAVSA
jgi:hypothetical protein